MTDLARNYKEQDTNKIMTKKLQVRANVTNCNLGTKVILTPILWIEIYMQILGFQKEKQSRMSSTNRQDTLHQS